nr:B3 domain-containing protein Os01g0234100-like [Aegilops tauschii subsp. strangulata]
MLATLPGLLADAESFLYSRIGASFPEPLLPLGPGDWLDTWDSAAGLDSSRCPGNLERKGGMPAGDSPHSARSKMGQKMSLAHRRLSFLDDGSGISRHIAAAAAAADDDGGGSEQMDEVFTVDVPQKNKAVDGSDDDFVPLIKMRTKNVKMEEDREASRSKRCGKRKIEKKPMLVDNNNISKSNKDMDADVEPEGVPLSFCRNHLPNDDVTIALEDEDGHSYDTKYLARKQGLSGGWHGFVVSHGLKVGDAVIFQLVGLKRFKVYILRENKFTTTDGALGLLSLDASVEHNIPEKEEESSDEDVVKSKKDLELTKVITNKASDDDSNDLFSEEAANGGIRSAADPDPDFDGVKTFRAFKIAIDNNSVINSKLVLDRLLWTSYKLCGARKAFLHRRLPKHINPTLAAGVIAETASITEGIRSYPTTSSSSLEDLAAWKRTLESFELLGMDVGFMRKRVDELLFLLDARPSSDDHPQEEGYEEVMKLERAHAAEKVRALETKMASLKDALEEMDMEMEEIAGKRRGRGMLQLAAAPW